MIYLFCIPTTLVDIFCISERKLSDMNLSSVNNFTNVSTESSSCHQGEMLAKLFSKLKLISDNLLSSFMQEPTKKPLKEVNSQLCSHLEAKHN